MIERICARVDTTSCVPTTIHDAGIKFRGNVRRKDARESIRPFENADGMRVSSMSGLLFAHQ
jgi:hypothetical protein